MWTTGQLASVIEISLKLAMSVLCACQVSSNTEFSVVGVAENSQLCGFFPHPVCFVFQIYSILQFQSYLHDMRVSIPGVVWLAHAGKIQSSEEGSSSLSLQDSL